MAGMTDPVSGIHASVTAAAAAAGYAARYHATERCRLAALLAAFLLPGAASLVFIRDEDTVSAETSITIVSIRDSAGALLWYSDGTGYAGHPEARAMGTPPVLDPAVLGEIQVQLEAAYDASPGHFDTTGDGAEQMPEANLLVLPVAALTEPPQRADGLEVVVAAGGHVVHRSVLAGDDTVTVFTDGEPVLGVDRDGPGRWHDDTWLRLGPPGQLVRRSVSIEGITTEALWRDLETALGLRRGDLGWFKGWAADRAKIVSDRYDLDAAAAWAQQNGLPYEDEQCVRVVPAAAQRDGEAASV
jgi:hypothetical protein